MNPNDGFVIKAILGNYDGTVDIDGRIIGIKGLHFKRELQDVPKYNYLSSCLPPAIMILGSILVAVISINWIIAIPMLTMSLGFPIANHFSFQVARKKKLKTHKL